MIHEGHLNPLQHPQTGRKSVFGTSRPASHVFTLAYAVAAISLALLGCKSKPRARTSLDVADQIAPSYPARPDTPPQPFRLFHRTADSLTLVTAEHATDAQIEAIIWQLHDAALDRSFDKIHLPQKFIDARSPIVFIHIYRGAKCAAEKYAPGGPPCGGSYHAAGDYTLGSFANANRDDGVLLHDEFHQTELWNPDAIPTKPQGAAR